MNSITTPSNDVTGPRSKQVMKVWIDFVCPFCLLAESVIQKAIEGVDVDIQWMPFELREYPTPTLRPEDEYLPSIWRRSVYPMAELLGCRSNSLPFHHSHTRVWLLWDFSLLRSKARRTNTWMPSSKPCSKWI